jgi:hypothetical protein
MEEMERLARSLPVMIAVAVTVPIVEGVSLLGGMDARIGSEVVQSSLVMVRTGGGRARTDVSVMDSTGACVCVVVVWADGGTGIGRPVSTGAETGAVEA